MTGPGSTDAAALADQAWALVLASPRDAQALASAALAGTADSEVRSLAFRALGMASLEVGDVDTSIAQLGDAVAAAEDGAAPETVAEAQMALALALQHRGDIDVAIEHAERAVGSAPTVPRLLHQLGQILERASRVGDAIEAYRAAETIATEQDDQRTLARVWCNRGVLRIYRAEFDLALKDLHAAQQASIATGQHHLTSLVVANFGFLAVRRGDLVEALVRLDEVTPAMQAAGGLRHGVHELDRCEVQLLAGMPGEAVASGRVAIGVLDAAGMGMELAEAKVLTAQAALRADDPVLAIDLAADALIALRRRRAAPWEALAREVVVRAEWQQGRRDTALMQRARRVADDLEAARWSSSAASARILGARLALDLGHHGRARNDLRRVNAGPGSPVALRIQALHAEALLALADDDVPVADARLRDGWAVLEQHRATLGATELRVSAATHAIDIATLGLGLAVVGGEPAAIFDWAERVRAGALHAPPPRAPRDAVLAVALGELRVAAAEADAAAKEGADPRPALRRQAELEETIRRRAQIVPVSEGGASPAVDAEGLIASLGDHVLVEFLEVEGRLAAVVAADGACTLHWLGEVVDAEREIGALRMALRRVAVRSPIPALAAAARAAAEVAIAALERQLLEPLANGLAGRPVAVVPAGPLHSLPWSALRGPYRSLVVAPSATLWRRGRQEADAVRDAAGRGITPSTGAVLLAAGPGLAEADAEIADLAALYPDVVRLGSGEATIDAVRAGLAVAPLAHLACHGHFRDDNPLFSALELADGALSVFEFEDLPRVPARIVLSACDAGRSSVQPGNELLGVTAALLRLGAHSLVASTLPVPDAASRRLMTAAHRGLADGLEMSASLAGARDAVDLERDEDFVAAAAFSVLGSD